jgi:hypothetical protein
MPRCRTLRQAISPGKLFLGRAMGLQPTTSLEQGGKEASWCLTSRRRAVPPLL